MYHVCAGVCLCGFERLFASSCEVQSLTAYCFVCVAVFGPRSPLQEDLTAWGMSLCQHSCAVLTQTALCSFASSSQDSKSSVCGCLLVMVWPTNCVVVTHVATRQSSSTNVNGLCWFRWHLIAAAAGCALCTFPVALLGAALYDTCHNMFPSPAQPGDVQDFLC